MGGGALLTYAVINYHYSLKFIGVLGVLLTVTNKLRSYESPKAAYDDISGTISGVATKIASLKPPSLPKLPGKGGGSAAATAAAVPAGFAGLTAAADEEEQEAEENEVLEQQTQ